MNNKKYELIIDDKYSVELKSIEELNVKFNRVVDDLGDLTKKYGDFSYTIKIPMTKNNNRIFGNKNTFDNLYKYVQKQYGAKLIINDNLIFSGLLLIKQIEYDNYICNFFSETTSLSTSIGEKKLSDLNLPTSKFEYNKTQYEMMNDGGGYDDYIFQFPYIHYGTFFTSQEFFKKIYTDADAEEVRTNPVNNLLNIYNVMPSNSTSFNILNGRTNVYNFPPAVFLRHVIKQIFADADYNVSSTLFENDTFNNLIIPTTGEASKWDKALTDTQLGGKFFGYNPDTQYGAYDDTITKIEYISPNIRGYDYDDSFNYDYETHDWVAPRDMTGVTFTCKPYMTGPSDGAVMKSAIYSNINGELASVSADTTLLDTEYSVTVDVEAGERIYNTGQLAETNTRFIINQYTQVFYNDAPITYSTIQPAKFLPDMKQIDLLKLILNMYNLYMLIEGNNVGLYTYNDLFNKGVKKYNITDKVFEKSVKKSSKSIEVNINYDENSDNYSLCGIDGYYDIDDYHKSFTKYGKVNSYNYMDTELSENIVSDVKKYDYKNEMLKTNMILLNLYNTPDFDTTDIVSTLRILVPNINGQTTTNNNGKFFSENDSTLYEDDTIGNYDYGDDKLRILHYHGKSNIDNTIKWINVGQDIEINTGDLSERYMAAPILFASQHGYQSVYVDANESRAEEDLNYSSYGFTFEPDNYKDYANSFYPYFMKENIGTVAETEYAISMSKKSNNYVTLYDTFHNRRYSDLGNEIIECKIRMDDKMWRELQINKIIEYKEQIYKLIYIKGYDPIKKIANIKINKL